MPHDDLRELTGAYALGALTGDERRTFEAHLEVCPACAAEVRDFASVARGLDRVVEQVEPPAALRTRVLSGLRGNGTALPLPSAEVSMRTQLTDRDAPPRRPLHIARWMAAAASLGAIAAGAYGLDQYRRAAALEQALERERVQSAALQRELEAQSRNASSGARAVEILSAPDVARVDLAGQADAPGAAGRAFFSASRGIVFVATNLPPLPPGMDYQLWVVTAGGEPVSAGVFQADPGGGPARVIGPTDARDAQAVAVTREPAGGRPSPTMPMYLVGKVSG